MPLTGEMTELPLCAHRYRAGVIWGKAAVLRDNGASILTPLGRDLVATEARPGERGRCLADPGWRCNRGQVPKMKTKYLLIGGGLASSQAAKELRDHDAEGAITLVGAEPYL